MLKNIDISLFHLINSHHSHLANLFMQAISEKWTWIPAYLMAAFFIWQKAKIKPAIGFFMCILLAVGIADIGTASVLKPLIKRPRPCQVAANLPVKLHLVGNCGGKYGFPSSHSANFMAMAVMLSLFFKEKKRSILFMLCTFAVGYSRIYLGVHYPFDVLAGFAIGAMIGYACWRLYNAI